jgi:hypothetical protein
MRHPFIVIWRSYTADRWSGALIYFYGFILYCFVSFQRQRLLIDQAL